MSDSHSGIITSNSVSLQHESFLSNSPTFTLAGVTRGGPPTNYTWTRDGEVITSNDLYSISIAVTASTDENRQIAGYTSTLRVTGNLPGLYQYSVTNRATTTAKTKIFNITGDHTSKEFQL